MPVEVPSLRKRITAGGAIGGIKRVPSTLSVDSAFSSARRNAEEEGITPRASSSRLTSPRSGMLATPKPVDAGAAAAKATLLVASQAPSDWVYTTAARLLTWRGAFALLAIVRLAATMYYGLISDCDETFNYWEPSHYLLYGSGLQTWEYSPQYAFRSYAYVGFHSAVGFLTGAWWGADKISVFHRTRCFLALACAAAEGVFVVGAASRFGSRVGLLTLGGLAASAGMAHAAPSYLPSQWTMVWLLLAWGTWLRRRGVSSSASSTADVGGPTWVIVLATVTGLLLGWPFAVVALVPFGLHLLLTRDTTSLVLNGATWTALVLGLSAVVDRHYYGRWLCAAYHIILYNAFGVGGGGQGSDLYGTEPASWYAHNLLLNFNVLALLAAASPLAVAAVYARVRSAAGARVSASADPLGASLPHLAAALGQLWLWFALMSSRPHKEERFLFVIFPLVPLAAAVTLAEALRVFEAAWARVCALAGVGSGKGAGADVPPSSGIKSRRDGSSSSSGRGGSSGAYAGAGGLAAALHLSRAGAALACAVLALAALLSASRLAAMVGGYSAPFRAWGLLGRSLQYAGHEIHTVTDGATGAVSHVSVPRGSSDSHPLVALGGPSRWHAFERSRVLRALCRVPSWHEPQEPLDPHAAGFTSESRRIHGSADAHDGPTVCVGKEWYRYPSAYFLPESTVHGAGWAGHGSDHEGSSEAPGGAAVFAFVKSGFSGLLPQPYLPRPGKGSSVRRTGYNDENREEEDRYIPIDQCDFLIDYQLPVPREAQDFQHEPHFDHPLLYGGLEDDAADGCIDACSAARREGSTGDATASVFGPLLTRWRSLAAFPFLHSESTPALARAFWVPGYSGSRAVFGTYHVLQRIDCRCGPVWAADAGDAGHHGEVHHPEDRHEEQGQHHEEEHRQEGHHEEDWQHEGGHHEEPEHHEEPQHHEESQHHD